MLNRRAIAFSVFFVILHCTRLFAVGEDFISVATIQYPIEGRRTLPELNSKVESFIKQASKKGSKLIVFPEWLTLDVWPLDRVTTDREVVEFIADQVTAPYWEAVKQYSKDYRMIIVAGSTAYRERDQIFNAAAIFFPDGRMILQKKNYLTAWEKKNGLAKDLRAK